MKKVMIKVDEDNVTVDTSSLAVVDMLHIIRALVCEVYSHTASVNMAAAIVKDAVAKGVKDAVAKGAEAWKA